MHRLVCCFLLPTLLLATAPLQAQFALDELYVPGVFQAEDGTTLPYRLWEPGYPQSGERFPLIVVLHGSGECGTDNRRQLEAVAALTRCCQQANARAMVLVPQFAPGAWPVRGLAFAPDYALPAEPAASLAALHALCDRLVEQHRADPDRIVITGLSLGGFAVWDAAARWPDCFAGAVPVCGSGAVGSAALIGRLPVWAFHGEADRNVPVDCSRRMIRALKDAGASPRYTEYPGQGHVIWNRVYADPALLAWMLAQNRQDRLAPKPWWRRLF